MHFYNIVGLGLLLQFSFAQAEVMHHHAGPMTNDNPSTQAYQQSMKKMHQDMSITYTDDADVDFARGMIPHHQAAIEMAETQLKYGKDPVLRNMSQEIIQAQQAEIATLKQWLREHDAKQ